MPVYVYEKGDHPGGFIGIRVVVSVMDDYRQKYFSFKTHNVPEARGWEFEELIGRAMRLDERWERDRRRTIKQVKMSKNFAVTKPHRGVGFMGITLFITKRKKPKYVKRENGLVIYYSYSLGFKVSKSAGEKSDNRFCVGNICSYEQAWKKAVNHWAKTRNRSVTDRRKALAAMPSPEQFELMRKHMNRNGAEIPKSALAFLFEG
jgi:hypothetical protein